MHCAHFDRFEGHDAWRVLARLALSHDIAPDDLDWGGMQDGLFRADPLPTHPGPRSLRVPAPFVDLAESVLWHRDVLAPDLAYRALWRIGRGDRGVLLPTDPLGRRLGLMRKSVGRDIHKFHAFVRFSELPAAGRRRRFGAWFEPDHYTLRPASTFFARRFGDMDWVISTPGQSALFVDGQLSFVPHDDRPPDLPRDAAGDLWDVYFANIFNPARVKVKAMLNEMPRRYWKNMPETRLIPSMLQGAEERVERMLEAGASTPSPGSARISTRYRAGMADGPWGAKASGIGKDDTP